MDSIVNFNISGKPFVIPKDTILKYPDTYLQKLVSGTFGVRVIDGGIYISASADIFEYVHRFILYDTKINVPHLKQLYGCTEDEVKNMISFWGYGDEIYAESSDESKEYIEAAVNPSNNGFGAQWFAEKYCHFFEGGDLFPNPAPKEQQEPGTIINNLVPDEIPTFNQKTPTVAIEYIRRGWKLEKEFVKQEPFNVLYSDRNKSIISTDYQSGGRCDSDKHIYSESRDRTYWLLSRPTQ